MKTNLAAWLDFSFIDWDGNIAAVFFLPGCNFRCPFCHNHELLFYKGKGHTLEGVLDHLEKYRGWIDGIVVTGGEPTIHEDLPSFLSSIKERGWRIKLDTNGYNPDMLRKVIERELADYIAMDIKTSLRKYGEAVGREIDKSLILESIRILLPLKEKVEFRTTVVPKLVEPEDIKEIREMIGEEAKYVLQAFSPENAYNPLFRELKPYRASEVREWDEKAILRGFRD
ncbi:MAG: anaerobic ribonucleoside-triphosphate reductase activating protein [Synergistetes bacterium]|nr:MAG: Anaerobic ribonucleoside-triphosphate reductase activating protein [bacterium 42_11]MBC7332320.1 anaerobic ribonucleoside-triphosphate reductase activating protein [Synergistota bacterium]MDK2871973.1 pyruvate formate lyase activating enzyme [bacterium]